MKPAEEKYNPWPKILITFDQCEHPISVCHGRTTALVLDSIVDGFHLIEVMMDDDSRLNLIYAEMLKKMHFDESRIEPTKGVLGKPSTASNSSANIQQPASR